MTQSDVVAIPKSTHRERMEENFNIFDFKLTNEEMRQIEAMDLNKSQFIDFQAPEVADMFVKAGKI